MFRKLTTVFLFLLATSAFAHGSLKFVNGLWFNGTSFEKKTMYSVDNVFRTTFDGEAKVVDLGGRYVIPPLGDAHDHVFADTMDVDAQLAQFFGAGVFYVKNPNNSASNTAAIRARMNTPETVDVTYANGGLTRTGGHPAQIYARFGAQFGDAHYGVDSMADLERQWPAIRAGKPDFIKIYLEYSEDETKRRGLDPALVPSIVKKIHDEKLRVTAHVTSPNDFHVAVAAGVDEITHLPFGPIPTADITLAAKRGTTVVPTILSHKPGNAGYDHTPNLTALKRAGVTLAIGLDNSHHTVLEEAEMFAKTDVFTNLELLRILTETTPRAIFPSRKFARLADGYEASFITLSANPLENLAALRQVELRVKQGHVLARGTQAPASPLAQGH